MSARFKKRIRRSGNLLPSLRQLDEDDQRRAEWLNRLRAEAAAGDEEAAYQVQLFGGLDAYNRGATPTPASVPTPTVPEEQE